MKVSDKRIFYIGKCMELNFGGFSETGGSGIGQVVMIVMYDGSICRQGRKSKEPPVPL